MDSVSKEYQDLLDGVQYQGSDGLQKSQIKAHTRRTKSGKTVLVKEHEDKRPTASERAMVRHKELSSASPGPQKNRDKESADSKEKIEVRRKMKDIADQASNKADKSGDKNDHRRAAIYHNDAARYPHTTEHLARYHKEMEDYHRERAGFDSHEWDKKKGIGYGKRMATLEEAKEREAQKRKEGRPAKQRNKIPHVDSAPKDYEGPVKTDSGAEYRYNTTNRYNKDKKLGWRTKEHPEDRYQARIKEFEDMKADLQAGRITPRRVVGTGGTKKTAMSWIEDELQQSKADLREVAAKKIPRHNVKPVAEKQAEKTKKTPQKRITKEGADHLFGKDRKMQKSLVHAFKRVLKNGMTVFVKEHSDKRPAPKPRSDEESRATFKELGAAARERAKDAKPIKAPKQALADLSVESLNRLRYKLGGLTHKSLMNVHLGRPLFYWLAAIDAELGKREQSMAKSMTRTVKTRGGRLLILPARG